MTTPQFLKTRVPSHTKERVLSAAHSQLLSESIWLRRAVDNALRIEPAPLDDALPTLKKVGRDAKISVRLRAEDQLLLRERAAARGMPTATYVSVLVRAHLRNLTPMPASELQALKQTIAELTAVGRNLNQLARAANQGLRIGSAPNDFSSMLKICEALRDDVKALLNANLVSWRDGHAQSRK